MSAPAATSSSGIIPEPGLVVGTVYSAGSLSAARLLEAPPGAPDVLELRVDHFAAAPRALAELAEFAARAERGLIVTVRHPAEGGQGNLGLPARRQLYERFLPRACYVDLELRSLAELEPVAANARATAGGLIASYHDFERCPDLNTLRGLAGRAAEAGAAIFKVAVRLEQPAQLALLLEFLATERRVPLAVMGMGPLGRLSRLLGGALGSRLNYGYLGTTPQVPGQWPASVLRARLDELAADSN